MINYIKGDIKLKFDDALLIVANNIGFKINIANIDNLLLESEIELFVKGYVRDDVYVYYGFKTTKEYELFEKLIKVDGVGPKTAMSILAKIPVNELITHIGKADFAKIKSYGISDKIAKKIVVELVGRINKCGVISPRYDLTLDDFEKWTNGILPSRQFGHLVISTNQGIFTHE